MYHDNMTCDGCDDENVTCVSIDDRLLCADCCRINDELASEFEDDDCDLGVEDDIDPDFDYESDDYEDDIYADDRYNMSDAYDDY